MPDPEKTETTPIQPMTVTVISGTGDGAPIPSGTVMATPDHQPNLIIQVVGPIAAILVRFINTFLTALLGILMGAMTSNVIQASDFIHLVYKCAGLAVAGAGVGLLKDLITVFGKLEGKYPLATGSV